MIRKIIAEPAIAVLTITVVLAIFFLATLYRQKHELYAKVERLEKQIEDLVNLKVGDIVPALEVADAQGRPSKLLHREGEKQLLMIFSPRCTACKIQEASVWNRLATQVKGKGYQARGILMGNVETLAPFLQEHPYQFEILVPDPLVLRRNYRINAIPQVVLLNGVGKVELIHYGVLNETELPNFLAKIDSTK